MDIALVFLSVFIGLGILFTVLFLFGTGMSGGAALSGPPHLDPSRSSYSPVDFVPTQLYVDETSGSGIAVHEGTRQVGLLAPGTAPRTVAFTDLVASRLVKNGEAILTVVRSYPPELARRDQSIGRPEESPASISVTPASLQHIELVVTVNDGENPLHRVTFLDMEVKAGGMLYEQAMRSAEHWHHLIGELIHQADRYSQAMEALDAEAGGQKTGSVGPGASGPR